MSEKGGFGKGTEMEKIGKEALKLTNEFRSKSGLSPLKWSPSLFIIATKHRFFSSFSFLFFSFLFFSFLFFSFLFLCFFLFHFLLLLGMVLLLRAHPNIKIKL